MKPRVLFIAIAVSCFALMGFGAFWLQGKLGLLPCPLCVVQRIAFLGAGLTALAAAALGLTKRWAVRFWAAATGSFALAGLVVALRHVWLTYFPQSIECGISPEEQFLNALALARWWPGMFEANGDCAAVKWKFLALSIPEWSAMWFAGLLLVCLFLALRRR
ncbi:MAG TPA: disulfide bond formation protein B [Burkholderiales bacterium]|nr:disulfide bond formation protein B [Burkholderiales bacterium]